LSKFLRSFFIIFGLSLALFNFRFLLAEGKYQLERLNLGSSKRLSLGISAKGSTGRVKTFTLLPISNSRFFSLEIPSLGIRAPIILEKSTDPKQIFNRLNDGVVHYEDTPLPGEKGTSIILGHSSAYPWYKGQYGSVFALLGKLKEGDAFFITNGDKTLNYRISQSFVFNPFDKDDEQIKHIENTEDSSIILVSCWPVGTNYKRIAVKADLIN